MATEYYRAITVLAWLDALEKEATESEGKINYIRDFYGGDQGVELTDRQREYYELLEDDHEIESWGNLCRRVVDIPLSRLSLDSSSIAPGDPDAGEYAAAVTGWWQSCELDAEQKKIYEAALRDGVVGVVVEWNDEEDRPKFTPNLIYDGESGLLRFFYDSDGTLTYVEKRWHPWDANAMKERDLLRYNFYFPDRIERYTSENADKNDTTTRLMTPDEVAEETGGRVTVNPQPWVDTDGTPLGIAVIPFENDGGTEITDDIITIQKAVNHNLGEFDISIDYHGHPMLWTTGLTPETDSDGKMVVTEWKSRAMLLLEMGGQAQRIDPPDLERMFRNGVISWVHLLALVKGWPLWMIDRSAQPPSGVALKTMESSLVAQIHDKQKVFGVAWRRAFELARKLNRIQTGEELEGEIKLTWESPETKDELAERQAQQIKWEAGQIPVLQRWRELGYTEEQIDQMLQDKQREDDLGLADFVTGIEQ